VFNLLVAYRQRGCSAFRFKLGAGSKTAAHNRQAPVSAVVLGRGDLWSGEGCMKLRPTRRIAAGSTPHGPGRVLLPTFGVDSAWQRAAIRDYADRCRTVHATGVCDTALLRRASDARAMTHHEWDNRDRAAPPRRSFR
jgi:hypothetical protein